MFDDQVSKATHTAGNRVDWLVTTIGDEIVSGALRAGEKLSEPRLSARFRVNRAPLREAIRRLEERKLVVRRPKSGVRVADFSAEEFVDLLHVREGLEGIASRLAATRITAEEIGRLRQLCEEQAVHFDDPAIMLDIDLSFHSCIAKASGSAMLVSMLCDDFYAFFRIWRRRYPRVPGHSTQVLRQHRAIVDALAAGDAELGEYLMRHHVKTSRETFEALLRSQSEPNAMTTKPALRAGARSE